MYRTCVYCQGALGANESLEVFPVGRTLAFDAARGRLWVVCRQCGRWCLSPLEERWEAIEGCERLYRDTPTRSSTDQIGLATLADGTHLVRIGAPTKPEFAAWRYGREFGKRRVRALALYGGIVGVSLGATALKFVNPALAASIPLLGLIGQAPNWWMQYRAWMRPVARLPFDGKTVTVRSRDLAHMRLESHEQHGWQLNILHRQGRSILAGAEAERVMGRVLAHVNEGGGKASAVASAVRALIDAGSPEAYLQRYIAGGKGFLRSWRDSSVSEVLALEMALHEDTERVALEGELAALHAAWKEAEEIAAIADSLLLPSWVEERVRR